MSMTTTEIQERVERELSAHTDDDVLARAHQLKDRFPHVRKYRSLLDCHSCVQAYISQADGLRVLDLGCGNGERSLDLLKAGAKVSGIDISPVYIENCISQARELGFNEEQFDFQSMDAHNLEYAPGTFDLVIGNGILHHLDLTVSTNEILRVLKRNGRAVFLEPLAANPLLKILRWLTPKARTEDERPLSRADLRQFDDHHDWDVESKYCGIVEAPTAVFTSIVLRPFENNLLLRGAHFIERQVNQLGWLLPMNQYVLLDLVRNSDVLAESNA